MFDVPDDVWLHYVGQEQRGQLVCIRCWHWLTEIVDDSAYEREHGGPLAMWSEEFRTRHNVPADQPNPLPPEVLRYFSVPASECHT